jgi:hypothetical protein
MLIANGIEAADVTLVGGSPIGLVTFPVEGGFTALYGENGAGKTRVLNGIVAALTGVRLPGTEAHLRVLLAKYDTSYNSTLLVRIADLARSVVVAGDAANEPDNPEWTDHRDALLSVADHEVDELGFADPVDVSLNGATRALANQARTDMLSLVQSQLPTATADQLSVTLTAIGDAESPAWDAYVSYVDDDLSRFVELSQTDTTAFADYLPVFVSDALRAVRHHGSSASVDDVPRGVMRQLLLGRIDAGATLSVIRGGDVLDVDLLTSRMLREACSDSDGWADLIEFADFDSWTASDRLSVRASALSESASEFASMFTKSRCELVFTMTHPNTWTDGRLGRWEWLDSANRFVAADQLGSAHRRWASLAIQLANSDLHSDLSVLVIDEPENALHPEAQTRLAEGLSFPRLEGAPRDLTGTGHADICSIIAATHSPAILAVRDAHLIHVSRDRSGHVQLDRIDTSDDVDRLVDELGVRRADVLTMTRTWVLVEGEHDLAVFETVFRDEFAAQRARPIMMGGAKQTETFVNSQLLARFTDGTLLIVVDGAGSVASELWEQAVASVRSGDIDAAHRALNKIDRLPGGETSWVASAGLAALRAGQLERVNLVGLERLDIIDYLPVESFVPGASWARLRTEHAAAGKRPEFKEWLRKQYGAKVTTDTIRRAAEGMDDLGDLSRVLDAIEVGSRPPQR